jgi:hypothetical protein
MNRIRRHTLVLLLGLALAAVAGRALADDEPERRPAPPRRAEERPGVPPPGRAADGPREPRDEGRRPGPPPGPPERRDEGPGRDDGRREERGMPRPGEPGDHPRRGPGDGEWMRENDPEMFKLLEADNNLDRMSRELGMEARRVPKDKQDEVKKKLQSLVVEQFDARQQRRNLELKRLEMELKRIRESIEKREQSKQSIVERRVAELMGEEPQF